MLKARGCEDQIELFARLEIGGEAMHIADDIHIISTIEIEADVLRLAELLPRP